MKSMLAAFVFVFAFVLRQAPAPSEPLALTAEPNHKLLLENSYVRVFLFGIKGHEATLTHRHALDYASVTLGPADFTNAVAGKPEVRVQQKDAEVHFTRGGLVHFVRSEIDAPFRNFTIELYRPQGQPRNLCRKIVAGELGACDAEATAPHDGVTRTPYFETDEVLAEVVELGPGKKLTESNPRFDSLLAALNDSSIGLKVQGGPSSKVSTSNVAWLAGGHKRTYTNAHSGTSRFLLLSFKDSGAAH